MTLSLPARTPSVVLSSREGVESATGAVVHHGFLCDARQNAATEKSTLKRIHPIVDEQRSTDRLFCRMLMSLLDPRQQKYWQLGVFSNLGP